MRGHIKMTKELTQLKNIVKNHSFAKISGQPVDVQTANAMLTVRNAMQKKENQNKFDRMLKTSSGVRTLAKFSWSHIG